MVGRAHQLCWRRGADATALNLMLSSPLTSPPSEGGQGLFPHSTSSLGEQLRGPSSRQREDDLGERLPESFRSHPTGRRFHTPSVAASPRHLPHSAPPLGEGRPESFRSQVLAGLVIMEGLTTVLPKPLSGIETYLRTCQVIT